MAKISEKGKLKEMRGTGTGKDYKPWIKIRELNSTGTASTVTDYKNGREIQLLSQAELYYYYLLRWRDDVVDVREQFPLDIKITTSIANELHFAHPYNTNTRMTTDLLITKTDNTLEAFSIKTTRNELNNARTVEKLYIEKLYWESIGIPFHLVFKEDVNIIMVKNIIDVVSCYHIESVLDIYSAIRHLIAVKILPINIESAPLDIECLVQESYQANSTIGLMMEEYYGHNWKAYFYK